MTSNKKYSSKNIYKGKVRIISGKWRNRVLKVENLEGLRPTSERIRETLFNWLRADISGVNCLDLFAGTGSLGFEALSRGADNCIFIDKTEATIKQLKKAKVLFNAENCHIVKTNASDFLFLNKKNSYDLVFLDPPFADNMIDETINQIAKYGLVTPNGYIYIEINKNQKIPDLPKNWIIVRKKNIANVCFALIKVI
tara:strand:- start:289 stop:879 length:591 start_codon:yes stop_codon:yes gene_type:complete